MAVSRRAKPGVAACALLLFVGNHPQRLVNSAPIAYRSTVSYGERTIKWRDEKTCVLTFTGDFLLGPYHEGVIRAALTKVGAQNVTTTFRQTGPLDGNYTVSWG